MVREKRQKAGIAGGLVSLVIVWGQDILFLINRSQKQLLTRVASVCPSRLVPYTWGQLQSDQTTPSSPNRLQTSPLSTSILSVSILCTSPRTPFFPDLLLSNPTHSFTNHQRCHFYEVLLDLSTDAIASLKKSACIVTVSAKGWGRAEPLFHLISSGSLYLKFSCILEQLQLYYWYVRTFCTMLQDTWLRLAGSLLTYILMVNLKESE